MWGGTPKNHSILLASVNDHIFWFGVYKSQIFLKNNENLIIYDANSNLFIIKNYLIVILCKCMSSLRYSLRRIPL